MRLPADGPLGIVERAAHQDDDALFLASLYATIGCESVECVRLTSAWDMWVDEMGTVDRRPLNTRATLLASMYGLGVQLHGVAIVCGIAADGRTLGLTDDQIASITSRVTGSRSRSVGGVDGLGAGFDTACVRWRV